MLNIQVTAIEAEPLATRDVICVVKSANASESEEAEQIGGHLRRCHPSRSRIRISSLDS
jgi:hypothetical protein